MAKASLDLRRLEIRELTATDLEALGCFDCGDEDLNGFVRDDALRLASQRAVTTYLALYDAAIAAYVSLMVDAIVLETTERKRLALRHVAVHGSRQSDRLARAMRWTWISDHT